MRVADLEEKEEEKEGLSYLILLLVLIILSSGCSNTQVDVDWNDLSACCLRSQMEEWE